MREVVPQGPALEAGSGTGAYSYHLAQDPLADIVFAAVLRSLRCFSCLLPYVACHAIAQHSSGPSLFSGHTSRTKIQICTHHVLTRILQVQSPDPVYINSEELPPVTWYPLHRYLKASIYSPTSAKLEGANTSSSSQHQAHGSLLAPHLSVLVRINDPTGPHLPSPRS